MKPFHKEQFRESSDQDRRNGRSGLERSGGDQANGQSGSQRLLRLNFSHGTYEEHTLRLQAIRRIGEETGIQLAILQDLCGPKIRLEEKSPGA